MTKLDFTVSILRDAVNRLEHGYHDSNGVLKLYEMPSSVYGARADVLAAIARLTGFPYLIFVGGVDTMELIAERGVLALTPNTHRWKLVSKTVRYQVVKRGPHYGTDGLPFYTAELWADEDLRAAASEKGLIL